MVLDLDSLAAEVLSESLRHSNVGVVAVGLAGIDPVRILESCALHLNRDICAAVVGYPHGKADSRVTLSEHIEDAVDWRSTPSLAGRIVVFAQEHTLKLHSLGDLDTMSEAHIAHHALNKASVLLSDNDPQQRFWDALSKDASTFPLEFILKYIQAVDEDRGNPNAISDHLWRLGLLPDASVLDPHRDPSLQLTRNRELLVEMGLMSEQSRKRLSSVLVRAEGQRRQELRHAVSNLKGFYRTGDRAWLRELDFRTVAELLVAGRPITGSKPSREPARGTSTENGDPGTSPTTPLKGRHLVQAIADCVVRGSQEDQNGLHELGEAMLHRLNSTDNASEPVTIAEGFGGKSITLETGSPELQTFMHLACSPSSWGGVLRTQRTSVKDALLHSEPEQFAAYSPIASDQGVAGQSLFAIIGSFDRYLSGHPFSDALERMTSSREALCSSIGLIICNPLVAFGGYPEARKSLNEYIAAFSELLRLFRVHDPLLHTKDSNALRFAAGELLRLDVVYIRTASGGWKAVLTPLHPFHLWRFRELLGMINDGSRNISDDERDKLAEALPDLPHLLHFVVFSPEVAGAESMVLPQAGSVEQLPTYENHTNRYLGNDGLDFLKQLIQRFTAETPYARVQLRMALVDTPDLRVALTLVSEMVPECHVGQVLVDAYTTRGHNAWGDIAGLDYEDRDYRLGEMLKTGRITVSLKNCSSLEEVATKITDRPVHIAFFFDQAEYAVSRAPRARQLLVSPLVISYQYDYSESFHMGTISPSSEAEDGLFSDFHFLVERAAQLRPGEQLRLQFQPGAKLGPINVLLESGAARWLAVADRILTAYAPTLAIPLAERRQGQRELAVWTRATSQTLEQLTDILARYHLRPDKDTVAELLRRHGHVASGGLLSLPPPGGNAETRENQQKGLLGVVLAAAWYSRTYPGSLMASLDSNLARLWLQGRPDSGRRADLIGLRMGEGGSLIVEPIEVKTRSETSEVIVDTTGDGDPVLSGPAVDQLASTLATLAPIFGGPDDQPVFTPARREVLKYQLHRECFRESHPPEWQRGWYEKLRDAFSLPSPNLMVSCMGLVLHVKLEDNVGVTTVADVNEVLRYTILGALALQPLVERPVASSVEGCGPMEADPPTAAYEPVDMRQPTPLGRVAEEPPTSSPGTDHEPEAEPVESGQREQAGELKDLARSFLRAAQSYHIQVDECDPERAVIGPTVVRFYVKLRRGQRLDQIRNALEDMGREMRRSGLLIAPIPNSDMVALDVPRASRDTVPVARGLAKLPPIQSPDKMPIIVGVTPEGTDIVGQLDAMPHLLVGGTTGSGKTVFLYGLLASLLKTHPRPSTLRLFISTSKPEDFVFFKGLPHLETGKVVTDATEAIELLHSHVAQTSDQRGALLQQVKCRDIGSYNSRNPNSQMPPWVVVIDEFADLADQLAGHKQDREAFYTDIRRIAQMGRNRGIHLVLCTQRPSADLVPTNIRNLMNARVSLRVNDVTASRMILEDTGGEKLQNHGDLLYKDSVSTYRAQGYLTTETDLEGIMASVMDQRD